MVTRKENELIVHIGVPKMGMSSLQKFLIQNEVTLLDNGYCYLNTRETNFDDDSIRDAWRWREDQMSSLEGGQNQKYIWKNAFEKFNRLLENLLIWNSVVISDELIWSWNQGYEFVRFLKNRYRKVRLIVYLHRQDCRIESRYGEYVCNEIITQSRIKKIDYVKTFEEYCNTVMKGMAYYDKLKKFEEIVGENNIGVYTYEEAKIYGLCRHFINYIGLNWADFNNAEDVNVTPSVMDIEIKKRLNQAFIKENCMQVIDEEYRNNGLRFECSGYLLNSEERQKILDYFAEDNKKVAERYFNRKELFSNEVDYPQAKLNEDEVQANYIKVLEKMLINMSYKVKYPMLVKQLNAGKKVAFFGAGFMGRRSVIEFNLPAELILDNDKEKNGQMIGGIRVVWTGGFHDWKNYIILLTPKEPKQIEEQLTELGLKKGTDFLNIHEMGLW